MRESMQHSEQYPWSLSFVYPAYNEEENIEATVRSTAEVGERLLSRFEIIVVNDGSSDRTGVILEGLQREIPQLRVVDHETNRGYGAAVKSGFAAATQDLVFFSDSDGQFDIRELELLLPHVEEHDIVTGYRRNRQDPPHRRLNALGWNTLTRVVLGTGVRDVNCAFKVFRRGVFDQISINSEGALINAEVFGKARRLGMAVHEVPVTHLPRQFGTQTGAHPSVILRAFRELFELNGEIRSVGKKRRGTGPAVPLDVPAAASAALGGSGE
jgi:glycosyltransferase involved in cell wall biosynthesis